MMMMIWYSVAGWASTSYGTTYQSWRGLFCGLLTSSGCEKLFGLTPGGLRQLLNTTFIETPFHSRDLWKKCNGQPQTLFSLHRAVQVSSISCSLWVIADYYELVLYIHQDSILIGIQVRHTLGCKMFAQGKKQLETRVIIKISTQPC